MEISSHYRMEIRMVRRLIAGIGVTVIAVAGIGTLGMNATQPTEAATITCQYSDGSGNIRYSTEWNGSTATATKTATPLPSYRQPTYRTPTPTPSPVATLTPTPTATPIPWCQNADSN
jgi:hypothetical protein